MAATAVLDLTGSTQARNFLVHNDALRLRTKSGSNMSNHSTLDNKCLEIYGSYASGLPQRRCENSGRLRRLFDDAYFVTKL